MPEDQPRVCTLSGLPAPCAGLPLRGAWPRRGGDPAGVWDRPAARRGLPAAGRVQQNNPHIIR